ncbi:MAG: helix-turn-helix domain-containing protein [Caulobacteraceae bacterium]
MPLDTDAFADVHRLQSLNDDLAPLRPTQVVLNQEGCVGAALRAARESLGLGIDDIAQATRVRAAHIAALEAFDLDLLPSRPFAVGFVRAYARSLGLEPEAVVARFRAEAPRIDDHLRAPGGLHLQRHRRFGSVAVLVALVLGAVVTWNIARRAGDPRRHAGAIAARTHIAAPRTPPISGPAHLGAPLPPPTEAAAPPAYETPGLATAPATDRAAVAAETLGKPFVAAGAIYGAPPGGSGVILQATKSTALIVRGQGGAVYFARQLAAGEAWKAPAMAGLIVDAGNPASVEVFAGGVSRGPLTDAQTPLARLGD